MMGGAEALAGTSPEVDLLGGFYPLWAMANGSDVNMGNNIEIRDTEFFILISPKTGDNYLKYILLCFHAEHQMQTCNMFAQNTCPIFF